MILWLYFNKSDNQCFRNGRSPISPSLVELITKEEEWHRSQHQLMKDMNSDMEQIKFQERKGDFQHDFLRCNFI